MSTTTDILAFSFFLVLIWLISLIWCFSDHSHYPFFFFFLKVFIDFATILLLFLFWSFWPHSCGILGPQPGIEPALPALEVRVLTTGPPGKSCDSYLMKQMERYSSSSTKLCLTLLRPHGLQPSRLPHPWDSPGKNTGVGCHFLL